MVYSSSWGDINIECGEHWQVPVLLIAHEGPRLEQPELTFGESKFDDPGTGITDGVEGGFELFVHLVCPAPFRLRSQASQTRGFP